MNNVNPIIKFKNYSKSLEDIELWCYDNRNGNIEQLITEFRLLFSDQFLEECTDYINIKTIYSEEPNPQFIRNIKRTFYPLQGLLFRIEKMMKDYDHPAIKKLIQTYSYNQYYLIATFHLKQFLEWAEELIKEFESLKKEKINPPILKKINKKKPELNDALILFQNPKKLLDVHDILKSYFLNKDSELLDALEGKELTELLLFPHNQNKFVEVFKRLKYNGFILSTPKEIENWICSNFCYKYTRGSNKEIRNFNRSTVHDILTKDKGEPTKKERICTVDWLPFKSHLTRQKEAEKESL